MSSSTENEYIFETADPLHNIAYLTHERWDHITTGHPELLGEDEKIKIAIEDPNSIYPDKYRSTTYNYYYEHGDIFFKKTYGAYLKVVVDRELQGQIITAHFDQKSKDATIPIYIKP